MEKLAEAIHLKYPDMVIVLGGHHPSACYREILTKSPAVSYVARGEEGEESLLRLVQYLDGTAAYSDLTGLATRENGKVVDLKPTKRFKNIEQENIPFPARHLLPMENYIRAQEGHGPSTGRWTSILSSRGCPYACSFCGSRQTRWVKRSAIDVVDEMEHCVQKWNINEFHFEDDNMTINRDRLIEICDEIIERGLAVRWQTPNGIRASRTDRLMLEKMKASGCMHITLAPESGSERVLKEIIQKGNDFELDQLAKCGADANQIGLKVAAYFILGLPGETKLEAEETIQYAKRLAKNGVDEVAFSLFMPLPGTPLWEKVSQKLIDVDWLDLLSVGDLARATSWNDNMSNEELHRLRKRAYLSFYLTRMIYHPLAFSKSILNVFKNIEETKTERTLRQFLQRLGIKKKRFSGGGDLNAYPYDATATLGVLFSGDANYAYRHSLLRAVRLVVRDFFKSDKFGKRKG